MTTAIKPMPDWFDTIWAENVHKLPLWMRNDSTKKVARDMTGLIIEGLGSQATTPEGVRTVVAFAKIVRILRGSQGVLDSPNPTPEQVADAVERLVERVKP